MPPPPFGCGVRDDDDDEEGGTPYDSPRNRPRPGGVFLTETEVREERKEAQGARRQSTRPASAAAGGRRRSAATALGLARLVTAALKSREWRKRWHSGKQCDYYQHRTTGRRCVEEFDPSVAPQPRTHGLVGRDGTDLDTSHTPWCVWGFRMQGQLASQLERRKENRDRVYRKVDLLTKMLHTARDQAEAQVLRRAATPAPQRLADEPPTAPCELGAHRPPDWCRKP
eukprot:gene27899-970_t